MRHHCLILNTCILKLMNVIYNIPTQYFYKTYATKMLYLIDLFIVYEWQSYN